MSLIQQLKQAQDFTEREKDIARFVLEHPETIENMSSRELGHQTFTSAASVTRFCQKLGVKGFPEFKIKFVSDLLFILQRIFRDYMQICRQMVMWQLF